ncbi:hypothetical protein EV646_101146 [Kribbella antiqua]|uniref:S1 motif domain-containing protein n=1 Tax=Kribbella antiqua TaxID=2512217 RepID=A0A4R2IZ16_9ACTN|nr:hypothetical protein [Kribbella antiqua]TCO51163.1 hypothetical protein EV646_101146 [Kribbella antiqua]
MPDELDEVRARYPLGTEVRGRFVRWILPDRPGTAGMVVDLGDHRFGYLDVLTLPIDPNAWPAAGTEATFEVTQHSRGQVRLWPLDAALRAPDRRRPANRADR